MKQILDFGFWILEWTNHANNPKSKIKNLKFAACLGAAFFIMVLGFALFGPSTAAEACPSCKDMLVDPEQLAQRLGMARGFAWSIGLLIGMPALLVGGLTVRLIRAHRHRRQT